MANPSGPAGKSNIAPVSTPATMPGITIEGWDIKDADLVKLLEDTAEFLKNAHSSNASTGLDDKEMVFKRVDTGDLFTIAHRS